MDRIGVVAFRNILFPIYIESFGEPSGSVIIGTQGRRPAGVCAGDQMPNGNEHIRPGYYRPN